MRFLVEIPGRIASARTLREAVGLTAPSFESFVAHGHACEPCRVASDRKGLCDKGRELSARLRELLA